MNKYDFLSRLRNALSSLPQEERDAAMSYYEEFFSEAGEDNEQAVIASLGTPEDLAKSVIDENNRENPETERKDYNNSGFSNGFTPPPTPAQSSSKWSGAQIALFVILAVLSSPIWLGLLAAVIGVIVGLFGAVIGIIAAFGACGIGFFVSGIIALIHEPPLGLMLIGLSMVFIGLFPLAIYPMCKGIVKLTSSCIKGIGALINRLTGKREVTQ